ncbi:MAG TPA: hypothetical protein VIS96_04885 [Terrimicrobiaceae bacterium]
MRAAITIPMKLLVSIIVLLLWQGTTTEAAPPSLFYSLLPLNLSKEDSLKRAYAAVSSEVKGKIMRRSDDVALVNEEYNLAVHCRKIDEKKTFVTIIVAHDSSFNEAKGLALNIRRGMETGIFE